MAGFPPHDPTRRPAGPPEGTRLESVEEIRRAIQARQGPAAARDEPAAPAGDVMPFRPLRRPPVALLCILDDGREDGEWVRLRGDRTVLGRSEGDVVIPHDTVMSARHAELTRETDQGRCRWYLTDLQSTNGTYVRVGGSVLRHRQEMLIGSRLYRFDAAGQGAPAEPADGGDAAKGTRGWQSVSPADLFPSLVELTPRGEGPRFLLTKADNWVGRNPATCVVVPADDPLVSPQHARIYRDPKGRWRVENAQSLNGIWLRIDRMALDTGCQFQLGEQRFLLKVP
jgi:pSer/pThr/pTyr-binding forkhead associated (FHA) protein